MYYTYVLQSKKDGKLYTGSTKNLKLRFEQHQNGEVESTKYRRPLKLIYYETCLIEDDSRRREKVLKSYRGKMFIRRRLKSYFTGSIANVDKTRKLFFALFLAVSLLLPYSLFLIPYSTQAAVRIQMPPNYLRVGASSLVGHWTFDGIDMNWSTNTASDKSGNGKNGTMTNISTTTSPVKGKIGQALDFDGANDYVELGTGLDMNGEMTVSLWISPDIIGVGVSEIIANNNAAGNQQDYNLELNRTAGKLSSVWGSTVIITGNTTLSVNTWHHAVLVRSGSSGNWTAKIYLDGREDNSATTAVNPNGSNENTTIGRAGADPLAYFNGKIDDVRIYNRALSANEVPFLYRAGAARMDTGTSANSALTTGLVGQWTFDGIDMNWSTNKASDKSGSDNSGTLTNMSTTTSPVKGKIGQALDFDGVNDFVDMGSPASLDDIGAMTVSTWVKPNTAGEDGLGKIVTKDVSISSNRWTLYIDNANGPLNAFGFFKEAGASPLWVQAVNNSVEYGEWQHVVVTWDGSATATNVHLYKNGVELGYQLQQNGSAISSDAALPLLIGGAQDGSRVFDGSIDEVRLYSRVLSQSEILSLYQLGQAKANASQNSSMTSGLVGLWSFNGADMNWSTNKALDRSGNGNDGTLVSMSTTTSPVKGKVGQALFFDGSGDHVNAGSASTYNFTSSNFSVSFWIYPTAVAEFDTIVSRGLWLVDGWFFEFVGTRSFRFVTNQASTWQVTDTSSAISLNEWTHVVLTRNGGTARVFLNAAEASYSLQQSHLNPTTASRNLYFMRDDDGPLDSAGRLDEVRIYNRVLSATEILQLYNMGR